MGIKRGCRELRKGPSEQREKGKLKKKGKLLGLRMRRGLFSTPTVEVHSHQHGKLKLSAYFRTLPTLWKPRVRGKVNRSAEN